MTFFHHSISITQFPSLILYHFKIPHPFDTITHFSSLSIFHTICGSHTCHSMQFFFPQYPETRTKKKKKKQTRSPNLVKEEEEEKEKNKKKRKTPDQEKKKKRKTPEIEPKRRKGKKKSRLVKRCGWIMTNGSLCVFNYKNVI